MLPRAAVFRAIRYAVIGIVVATLWIGATIPSGFPVTQLAMFAGPGIVLAVAASWTGHAFARDRWEWDDALAAAVTGAALFPPIIGLFVAWTATFSPNVMAVLLVLSSWFALVAGSCGALVGAARRRATTRRRAARVELLQ